LAAKKSRRKKSGAPSEPLPAKKQPTPEPASADSEAGSLRPGASKRRPLRKLGKSGELPSEKAGDIGGSNMLARDGAIPAGGSGSGRTPILPLPLPSNVARLPSADRREKLRILEALLFAASEPLDEASLAKHLGAKEGVALLLEELQSLYSGRGVNLVRIASKWAFRTAEDLSFLLEHYSVEQKKLSKAALETLAIIAYHQPVTRAEIEEIRGVSTSKGSLDVLLEIGWVRLRGRRRAPGRPVTYGTTEAFLEHFGFDSVRDLPGLAELKGAGLLDSNLPPGFVVPEPDDTVVLREDEEPLEDDDPQAELELEPEEPLDGGEPDEDEEEDGAPPMRAASAG
jgi:segregation and condensation protein B